MDKRHRKLSMVELDAIEIYEKYPNLTIDLIAKVLKAPDWYIRNTIFKYLNGATDGEYLLNKQIKPPFKTPRVGYKPTHKQILQAIATLRKDNFSYRTNNG